MQLYSFDFDGCLADNKSVQAICLALSKTPNTRCIVLTSRFEDVWGNRPEFKAFCELHGIAAIHYTNGEGKAYHVKALGVTAHFDDDAFEINSINRTCGEVGILVNFKHYIEGDLG